MLLLLIRSRRLLFPKYDKYSIVTINQNNESFSGKWKVNEGVSAEAIITKDGVKDKTPVKLALNDGRVSGLYRNINKPGEYNKSIRLLANGI